jgi:23S rRNA pseudouridine1911/1915/1917 synthase
MDSPDSSKDSRSVYRFAVAEGQAGTRLDRFLVEMIDGLSRSIARTIFKNRDVRLNDRFAKAGARVRVGDLVEAKFDRRILEDWSPLPAPADPLDIVHSDDRLVILDKPAGIPCHPLSPDERGTLANALAARFPECPKASAEGGGRAREAGFCHRLDSETSGLIVSARTPDTYSAMRSAFSSGGVTKLYLAVVQGYPPAEGEVDAPLIQRKGAHKSVRVASPGAVIPPGPKDRLLHARTEFRLLDRTEDRAVLAVRIRTGRRHQIRAHLAHTGTPLVGDTLYGGPPAPAGSTGFMLRAHVIKLIHPEDGRPVTFTAPPHPDWQPLLPDDFEKNLW